MSHLPEYYAHLVLNRGLTQDQAVNRLALTQNAFRSAAQRRWYFANLGSNRKKSGKFAKKPGPSKGGKMAPQSEPKKDKPAAKPDKSKVAYENPATSAATAKALTDFLGDYKKKHPYGHAPLPELAKAVGALSIGQYQDAVRKLRDEGRVKLHPFTGAMYQLKNEEYAIVSGQEIKYYAELLK